MKRLINAFIAIAALVQPAFSQSFSLSDTTLTFKNQEGKVLTKEEVKEFMKGVFSLRQQLVDGKKVITLLPSGNDERSLQYAKLDTFKNSLINKPVAAFNLVDINKNTWNTDKLKGKIIIINFWFTACNPCIQEMPHLNKLVAENKDSSVLFIAPAPENETQVKKFLKKYAFDYNIIPSSTEFISAMDIKNFPTHLVVDKEGIIRQVFIGYADDIKEKLQAEIDKLVNQQR
jgi:cytochrome oxidase Cu insertion factor (SCO1/SenC/PrrC family)